MLLLAGGPASADMPAVSAEPLALRVGPCLSESRTSIQQVVSLELNRPVLIELASDGSEPRSVVSVDCADHGLLLHYVAGPTERQRLLDTRTVSAEALARTVALAVVELLEEPESPPRPPRATAPVSEPERQPPTRASAPVRPTRVSLLGTARLFPAVADLSLGARLRSRLLQQGRGALLLGVGGERASAARDAGDITLRVAYGELGGAYDLLNDRRFAVALDVLGEAGYAVLEGQPRQSEITQGMRLTGAWLDLQLGIAPRLRLMGSVELAARLGLGFMLLAPSATFDGKELDVWRGLNSTADLGLSVLL